MSKKYVVDENGLMQEVYDPESPTQAQPRATLSDKALTTPYTFAEATEAAKAAHTKLAPKTMETIQEVQDPSYTAQFGSDVGNMVDLIGKLFAEFQIPIALASKLIRLKNFRIHIKIDDSGSMTTMTNNGKTRWENTLERLTIFMKLLQVVPTGTVKISFLDRSATKTIKRRRAGGMTPAQFYNEAVAFLNRQFQRAPNGITPIYSSVSSMLSHARKKPTACYLITDGEPSSNDFEDPREEIEATKNLILGRRNAKYTPITLMCCSDIVTNTMWMHEIEEMACRPGFWGYVAAIQNYQAECLEVLNDQGAWFPYSQAVWLICNLAAALNPFDLDALDQHEPLTKPTLDNTFLGYVSTDATYEAYFNQHPNATWAFAEDYNAFKTTEYAYMIDSVRLFASTLGDRLNQDVQNKQVNTEFQALAYTEALVMNRFGRNRADILWKERQNFLVYHCLQMEQDQLNYAISNNVKMQQHLWGDYIVSVRLADTWQKYLRDFHSQCIQDAPPSYAAATSIIPGADNFALPQYQHVFTRAVSNYSQNYGSMFSPQQTNQRIQQQLSGGQLQGGPQVPRLTVVPQILLPDNALPADFERSSMCSIS
jgi:hypothetical protein